MKAFFPLLLLAGCASPGAPVVAQPPRETISFHVSSWGKPMSSWQLTPDGGGHYVETQDIGTAFIPYRLVTRRITAAPADHARIAALMASPRARAANPQPCRKEVTDMPYGEVSWSGGGADRRLAFDLGCTASADRQVNAVLEQADAAVKALAAAGPVIDTRVVEQR